MSDSDDGPPPLEAMSDAESDMDEADDVPELEDAVSAVSLAGPGQDSVDDDVVPVTVPPTGEDGPTLMDEMLAANAKATKERQAKRAAERKKEDESFGAGLKHSSMFSAPIVVAGDSSDEDEGEAGSSGATTGAGQASRSGVGGLSPAEIAARDKRRKRVHRRARNKKQEAKLLSAAAKGNVEGVRFAVTLSLNLNCQAPNKGGQTALSLAAHTGNTHIVSMLLGADADPNAATKTGKTPLMVATRSGKEEVVQLLLEAGGLVKLTDNSGKSALDYARIKKRHFIKELLQRAAESEVEPESDVEEEIYLTPSGKDEGLRIPEVQAAMKDAVPQLERTLKSGDWMTPDFLKKIAANPVLARGMQNPRFMAAIQEFQTQPAKAKKKYANDPAVRDFMTAFYSLMGDHFTQMGKKQEEEERQRKEAEKKAAEEARRAAYQAAVDSAPDEDVRKVLSNQEVMEMLADPQMKAVLQDASRPGRLRHWLNDKSVGPKLRLMQKMGLVQFQM